MPFDKILVVDDELIIRRTLQPLLQRRRYQVATACDLAEARAFLKRDAFDLVFLDVRLPDGDGTELLQEAARQVDGPLFVMMTGYATVESAVECMRLGAFDYLIKPFSPEQIDLAVKKAEEYRHIVNVNRALSADSGRGELIGESAPMQQLKKMLAKVARTSTSVLITGENGTGKERIASEIHRLSDRADKPFIKVNCAAVNETLMESEFFGHEKGAFTGADRRREGRFELADGGTLLLDEISEISPGLQAKLLRVLQEREFERVGGNKTLQVDVRVLATTNRDLEDCVERGTFRQDLLYRLNVFPLESPPLRERAEDIPLLADHFARLACRKIGTSYRGFSEEATRRLRLHRWPGNVRELQNTLERAAILLEDDGLVQPDHLGLPVLAGEENAPLAGRLIAFSPEAAPESYTGEDGQPLPLEEVERRHILDTLEAVDGNRTRAAEVLGIGLRTLRNKIKQYRLEGVAVPESLSQGGG